MSGSSLETCIDRVSRNRVLTFVVLAAVISFAYGNMFLNGFIMDDLDFIVNWTLIQDMRNFPRFFWGYITPDGQEGIYSPLRTLFFALNYMVAGANPLVYHLSAWLTHLAGTWAVYLIAAALLRSALWAFVTALLFAVHPIHIESVTAMTGSIDTIGVVFFFYAFYFYLKAVDPAGKLALMEVVDDKFSGGTALSNRAAYVWSVVFAVLAVFTHELTVALPVLFLFYDVFFRRVKDSWTALARRNAPFFGIVLVYVLLKALNLGGVARGHYLMGKLSLSLLVTVKAWFKYVWLMLFPMVSTHNHEISPGIFSFNEKDFDWQAVMSQSLLEPQVMYSLAGLAGLAFLAVRFYRSRPILTFAIGWFFLSLLPVCGIIPSAVYFAERYLYPGSMGFCLILAYYLRSFFRASTESSGDKGSGRADLLRFRLGVCFMAALMGFYAYRVMARNHELRNEVAFYEAAVKAAPGSADLRNDLGVIYLEDGQYEQAVGSFEEGIRLRPTDAHLYFSAEQAYSALERFPDSIRFLNKAIALNPDFAEAYHNLAGLKAHLGKEDESLLALSKALDLYRKQGRILEAGEAVQMFQQYYLLKNNSSAIPGQVVNGLIAQ